MNKYKKVLIKGGIILIIIGGILLFTQIYLIGIILVILGIFYISGGYEEHYFG